MIVRLVRTPLGVALVGLMLVVPALTLGLRTGGANDPTGAGESATAGTIRDLPVGGALSEVVDGRRVSLTVSSEVLVRDDQQSLAQIPTGAPTTLTITIAGADGRPLAQPNPPAVRGWWTEDITAGARSTLAVQAAGHNHGSATPAGPSNSSTSTSTGKGTGTPTGTATATAAATVPQPSTPTEVSLARPERLMVNLAGGAVAGVASASPAHAHSAQTEPGAGLAATMSGAAYRWMVRVTEQADEVLTSADGRWAAVVDRDRGVIDVVDVLQRRKAGRAELSGRLEQVVFSPAGWLWALDIERHRLVSIEPSTARVRFEVAVPHVERMAPTVDGRWLLGVGTLGATQVIDAASGAQQTGAQLPGNVRSLAATAAGNLVAAHADGTLSRLSISDSGTLSSVGTLSVGQAADIVAVPRDGSKAVVLDTAGDRVTVVDLLRGEVTGTAATAEQPAQIVFLDGFAVVRNRGSSSVTWVDLADPSKSNDVPLGAHPAAHLVVTHDGSGVLASSPADGNVYHLHAMMGRPMVMGQDRLVAGADRVVEAGASLGEIAPGRYQLHTAFERSGRYRIEVDAGSSRPARFEIVAADPEKRGPRAIPEKPNDQAKVGTRVTVRFRGFIDASDATVLAYVNGSDGSTRQDRLMARWDGRAYEASFTPEVPGTWRLFLVSEASNVKPADGMPAELVVSS